MRRLCLVCANTGSTIALRRRESPPPSSAASAWRIDALRPPSPPGVGRDQHLNMLVGDDVVHLLLVPIARVGNSDSWSLCHANRLELALRGFDHRLEMTEVRGARGHLGGEHDLLVVHDGLSVVTLGVAARGLHVAGVKIGRVDLPGGYLRRLERFRWGAGAPGPG